MPDGYSFHVNVSKSERTENPNGNEGRGPFKLLATFLRRVSKDNIGKHIFEPNEICRKHTPKLNKRDWMRIYGITQSCTIV